MNSTGAYPSLTEQQLKTCTHTNTHGTEFLNFAHLIVFSEMSLYVTRYAREYFPFNLDRWWEK